jgi:biotin transporter BioY
MLPSEADRQAWFSLALYCGVAVVVLYGLGVLQPIIPRISNWLLSGLNHLSLAFLLTIVVDAVVILLIFLLERAVMIITGRRVEY